jgi:hypothetical protein
MPRRLVLAHFCWCHKFDCRRLSFHAIGDVIEATALGDLPTESGRNEV